MMQASGYTSATPLRSRLARIACGCPADDVSLVTLTGLARPGTPGRTTARADRSMRERWRSSSESPVVFPHARRCSTSDNCRRSAVSVTRHPSKRIARRNRSRWTSPHPDALVSMEAKRPEALRGRTAWRALRAPKPCGRKRASSNSGRCATRFVTTAAACTRLPS